MADDNLTGSVIARCLSVAARRVAQGDCRNASEFMKAQFGEIAEEVAPWNLSGTEKARSILRPTRERLVAQYGLTDGWRLYREFVSAFWPLSWSHPTSFSIDQAPQPTFRFMPCGFGVEPDDLTNQAHARIALTTSP